MIIAVTFENNEVFQHFGHTKQFKIYTVENNKVIDSQIVDTNGQGHGALANFLQDLHVNTLICGGIGGGAQMALKDADVMVYGGVTGNVDQAVNQLLNGTLIYDPTIKCEHHNHEEGHTCGDHGCGSNLHLSR